MPSEAWFWTGVCLWTVAVGWVAGNVISELRSKESVPVRAEIVQDSEFSVHADRTAFAGIRRAPYAVLFRLLVAPRLGPGREREPEAPLQFAQHVGFVFALTGAAGYLLGAPVAGAVATGLALVAALLNAATGFCLGCELHLLLRRALPVRTA